MNKEKLLDENSKHALQSDNIIAITNRHLCSRPFMEQLERVCKLHPHAIVLREKDMPEAEYLSLARDVIALCKKYDVQCMLHSFINVAMELEHIYICHCQSLKLMSKKMYPAIYPQVCQKALTIINNSSRLSEPLSTL